MCGGGGGGWEGEEEREKACWDYLWIVGEQHCTCLATTVLSSP